MREMLFQRPKIQTFSVGSMHPDPLEILITIALLVLETLLHVALTTVENPELPELKYAKSLLTLGSGLLAKDSNSIANVTCNLHASLFVCYSN